MTNGWLRFFGHCVVVSSGAGDSGLQVGCSVGIFGKYYFQAPFLGFRASLSRFSRFGPPRFGAPFSGPFLSASSIRGFRLSDISFRPPPFGHLFPASAFRASFLASASQSFLLSLPPMAYFRSSSWRGEASFSSFRAASSFEGWAAGFCGADGAAPSTFTRRGFQM